MRSHLGRSAPNGYLCNSRWGGARIRRKKLFNKPPEKVHWISGRPVRSRLPVPVPPSSEVNPEDVQMGALEDAVLFDETGLVENEAVAALAAEHPLAPLVGRSVLGETIGEVAPARVLHHALRFSPVIGRLEEALWQGWEQGILRLKEVARHVWGNAGPAAVSATATLLQLGSRARESATSLPLVPGHKLHLVARAPITVSVCMNPRCSAKEDRLPGAGRILTEAMDRCPDCGRATLTLCRCSRCGEVLLSAIHRDDNTLNLRPRWRPNTRGDPRFWYARDWDEKTEPPLI